MAPVISLGDLAGSTVVLNVVNSVDTPVCDVQTRRVDGLFPGAKVLTVSMDLPFALARWTAAAGVSPSRPCRRTAARTSGATTGC